MTDSKMTPARVVERLESLAFVAEHDRFTAEYESMAETVRALEAERDRLRGALHKIATGDGVYGMQALEYKNIARAALNPSTGVGGGGS